MILMHKYYNKRGFSLAELLAVMAIIAILAVISVPFIRDYMRDAEADKAKAVMNVIAQGYRNFRADYPGSPAPTGQISVNNATTGVSTGRVADVNCSNARDTSPAPGPGILFGCRYIQGANFIGHPFEFHAGDCPAGGGLGVFNNSVLACIRGTGTDARYGTPASYKAWVTNLGEVRDIYSQ